MGQSSSTDNVHTDLENEALSALHISSSSSFTSPHTLTDRVRLMVPENLSDDCSVNESSRSKSYDNLVPTIFSWVHGGENVFISGSFNQWAGKIRLNRSTEHFTILLDVPPGKHQYKFIVDEEWRYASDQTVISDEQGTFQNEILVEPYQEQIEIFPAEKDEDERSTYGQVCCATDEYSTIDPPNLPPHLGFVLLNVNTNATLLNPDPLLPVPQHVILNHIYNSIAWHDDIIVIGSTQRCKAKFVTTVFYKPKHRKQVRALPPLRKRAIRVADSTSFLEDSFTSRNHSSSSESDDDLENTANQARE